MQSFVDSIYQSWPESLHWLIVPWGWLCVLIGSVFILLIGSGLFRHFARGKPMINGSTGQSASNGLVIYATVLFVGIGVALIWLGSDIVR